MIEQEKITNICNNSLNKSELIEFLKICNKRPNARLGFNVRLYNWLPGYVVKYGIERYFNSIILKNIINKYNLTLIDVPQKFLFKLSENKFEEITNNNTLVMAEYINSEKNNDIKRSFLLKINCIKQLILLIDEAHYYDIHIDNLVLSADNNKIYIIDTDTLAMPPQNNVDILIKTHIKYGLSDNSIYDTSMRNLITDPIIRFGICIYTEISKCKSPLDNDKKFVKEFMDEYIKQRNEDGKKLHKEIFKISFNNDLNNVHVLNGKIEEGIIKWNIIINNLRIKFCIN